MWKNKIYTGIDPRATVATVRTRLNFVADGSLRTRSQNPEAIW